MTGKEIDIAELAEAADRYADSKLGKGEYHPDWHDVRDEYFARAVAESLLDIPARGWIPTAEQQPTKSGTYAFVTVAANERKKAFVTFASYWIKGMRHMSETGWASDDDEELNGVIAWMQMPDPYTPNV